MAAVPCHGVKYVSTLCQPDMYLMWLAHIPNIPLYEHASDTCTMHAIRHRRPCLSNRCRSLVLWDNSVDFIPPVRVLERPASFVFVYLCLFIHSPPSSLQSNALPNIVSVHVTYVDPWCSESILLMIFTHAAPSGIVCLGLSLPLLWLIFVVITMFFSTPS